MGDTTQTEQAEPADPSPSTEVEITVAGHTIAVKAAEPLAVVAEQALALFHLTARYARRAPIGFDVGGGQFDLAAPYTEPGLEPDVDEGRGRR